MNNTQKTASVFAADLPAVPDTGCILLAGGFLTWLCAAGIVLLFITVLHFGKIMAGINRSFLYPAINRQLENSHTHAERLAFSNAFMHYTDVMYYQGITHTNAWTITAMTNILIAAQDNVLTRNESSNFVASVMSRITVQHPEKENQ